MPIYLSKKKDASAVPIHVFRPRRLRAWLDEQPQRVQRWTGESGFEAEPGRHCLVPGRDGSVAQVVMAVADEGDPWAYAALPTLLPRKRPYRLATPLAPEQATAAALGWALGTYCFDRYSKRQRRRFATLLWPAQADRVAVTRLVEGVRLGRDLINTPASDMGPEELARAGEELAERHDAQCVVLIGEQLLKANYPAIHAVGRASSRAPRLLDLRWGNPRHPKVTLVGKGVCFDTGGLDLKPAGPMKLMKKDMGGAALVLGLAHVVMSAALPVRLRVLIPAVENSVAGNAFRPLDVLTTRRGITVEVGNTDAEGRLVLADALAEADSEHPDLVIDAATLTGAARVALGPAVPAVFSNDPEGARALLEAARRTGDPLWQLPLHAPYRKNLDSPVADINNVGNDAYGGAITAALFLKEFLSPRTRWVHVDTMGWNLESLPGRPAGGEVLGLRALARWLEERYRGSES